MTASKHWYERGIALNAEIRDGELLRQALNWGLSKRFMDSFLACQAPARTLSLIVVDWRKRGRDDEVFRKVGNEIFFGGIEDEDTGEWMGHWCFKGGAWSILKAKRRCELFLKNDFDDWPLFKHWESIAEAAAKQLAGPNTLGGFDGYFLWCMLLCESLDSKAIPSEVPGNRSVPMTSESLQAWRAELSGETPTPPSYYICEFPNVIESSIALAELLSREAPNVIGVPTQNQGNSVAVIYSDRNSKDLSGLAPNPDSDFSPENAEKITQDHKRLANASRKRAVEKYQREHRIEHGWFWVEDQSKVTPANVVALNSLLTELGQIHLVEALKSRIQQFLKLPEQDQERYDCLYSQFGFRGPQKDSNSQYASRLRDVVFCCAALLSVNPDERLLLRSSESTWRVIKSEIRATKSLEDTSLKKLRALAEPSADASPFVPDSENDSGSATGRKAKSKRGRKPVTKASREEKRICEAWKSGRYKTHSEVDTALDLEEGETKAVLDRLRKRKSQN